MGVVILIVPFWRHGVGIEMHPFTRPICERRVTFVQTFSVDDCGTKLEVIC